MRRFLVILLSPLIIGLLIPTVMGLTDFAVPTLNAQPLSQGKQDPPSNLMERRQGPPPHPFDGRQGPPPSHSINNRHPFSPHPVDGRKTHRPPSIGTKHRVSTLLSPMTKIPVFSPKKTGPSVRFNHLGTDDGLSQSEVSAIIQDKHGFMWFGTDDGLNRFDGYQFKVFKHDSSDSKSLSHNRITDILEDKAGMLWIATLGGGVNRFDPETETFTQYQHDEKNPNSIGGDVIFSIFQDHSGNFWFGGPPPIVLTKYDPLSGVFTHYDRESKIGRWGAVWEMIEDQHGNLWVTTDNPLIKFNPGTEQITPYFFNPNEKRLNTLSFDSQGNLWLGGGTGFYKFYTSTEQFDSFPFDTRLDVDDVLMDSSGGLWIGTLNQGVYQFDPEKERLVDHHIYSPFMKDSLRSRTIQTFYEDREGLIWIGTKNGVDRFNPQQTRFSYYHHDPDIPTTLAQGSISSLDGDVNGNLWIGTEHKIDRFEAKNEMVSHYFPTSEIRHFKGLSAIHSDREGFVWFGIRDRLYRFEPLLEKFTKFTLENLPRNGPPIDIDAIYKDTEGVLWLGIAHRGLFSFDSKTRILKDYPVDLATLRAIGDLNIKSLFEDSKRNLWLGSQNGILSRFDLRTKTFFHYTHELQNPDKIQGYAIMGILEHDSGSLWLATTGGLAHFDPVKETFTLYTEKDGLPTSFVVSILADQAENLWLGTKKGLSRFSLQSKTFHNYTVEDGLQGNEFNPNAAWQSPDGQLFFGGTDGLTALFPDQISDNPYKPPLVLTELRLFNLPVTIGQDSLLKKAIWKTEDLTFSDEQDIISLEFSALSYSASNKNRYRYKLEGFEKKWNATDSFRRFVTYTNLPSGKYTFRVQGTNNDEVWSDKEASLKVTILPPWWETFWFRGTILILLMGLALSIYRWRIKAVEYKNRLLKQQVTEQTKELRDEKNKADILRDKAEVANRAKSTFLANMSHELRTPLNAILGFSQIMAHGQNLLPEQKENLQTINRGGEHLLSLINDVLDMSKIEAGQVLLTNNDFDLFRLLDEVTEMFQTRLEEKGLKMVSERASDLPQYVRTDQGKLRQVLINLISNSVKFTKEGGITLRVNIRNQKSENRSDSPVLLQFEIEDTGPGMTSDEKAQVFVAFCQTKSGKDSHEGTGLGLSISQQFVQLMGGEISINSQVGQGTVFYFDIEVRRIDKRHVAAVSPTRKVIGLKPTTNGIVHKKYRILIVDDILTNRQVLVALLAPLELEVKEASGGQEALEVWKDWQPHLIWLDMRMPGVDGYQVIKQIKNANQEHISLIISISASAFEEDKQKAIEAGCDGFVRKPFRESEIFEVMKKHLSLHYIYEDSKQDGLPKTIEAEQKVLTSRAMEAIPSEWKISMKQAIQNVDLDRIKELIIQLPEKNSVLAEMIQYQIDQYEYEKVLEWLQ